MIDLMGGQVTMMFATLSTVQPLVKAGKLVALAVSTSTRAAVMPEIPTVSESGVPGYSMRSWNGLLAPRGTPKPIVQKLNGEVVAALREPAFVRRLVALGFEPDPDTPEEFATFIRGELALHARIMKAAGMKRE